MNAGFERMAMSDEAELSRERVEILALRARVVVLEKMAMAALELALRIRPEELHANLELARSRLSMDYRDLEFVPDITEPGERSFLAGEVERLMRGLQADLGLPGGIHSPEKG